MGIPSFGDKMTREVVLPSKQKVTFSVLAAHAHVGAVPEFEVSIGDNDKNSMATVRAALNSSNELRHVAGMLSQMANRIDQINEEARDDYYEDEE